MYFELRPTCFVPVSADGGNSQAIRTKRERLPEFGAAKLELARNFVPGKRRAGRIRTGDPLLPKQVR